MIAIHSFGIGSLIPKPVKGRSTLSPFFMYPVSFSFWAAPMTMADMGSTKIPSPQDTKLPNLPWE